MANQMIALGVRAPQMPDLGRATQQYGAMLGVAAQQRASQRQAEQAEQAMQIARNQEQRAVATHEIEQAGRQIDFYTKLAGQTMNSAGYEQFLGRLDRDAPEIAAQFRTNLPPENFDRGALLQMVGSIADNFRANFGPLETEVVQLADGTYGVAQTGGVPGTASGVFQLQEFEPAPAAGAPPATGAPAAPAAGALTPEDAAPVLRGATESGTISPADADRIRRSLGPNGQSQFEQWMRDNNVRLTPASFGGEMGGVQPLTMETAPQIIQNAVQSRMIDQTHLQQLREMVGPDNERNLASWMQSNQIRIQPTGGMAQPSLRSAEYRPGMDAAPQFQQVQAVTGPGGATYRPTGRAAQGRPPLVSPTQVPSSAGAVAGATEAAEQAVRVTTQPQIRAGEERVTRLERLRSEAPRARSEVDAVLSHTARRIDAIDRMLASRNYESIVGMIEGRIPRVLQDPRRSTAQRLLDNISNTDVIQDIIASRSQTETGGSPLGNVSNSDLQMYANAANELTQTGDEASFREALLRMRRELVGGMRRARRTYEDTFRPLGDEMRGLRLEAPQPPAQYTPPREPSARRRTPTRAAPTRTRGGAAVSNW